jgi:hypothetical protein
MDAWKQHSDLVRECDRQIRDVEEAYEEETWRNHEHPNIADLRVKACAWDRCVYIEMTDHFNDKFSEHGWEVEMGKSPDLRTFTWLSRHTTTRTARQFAQAIFDACDFVDRSNPFWAGITPKHRFDPGEDPVDGYRVCLGCGKRHSVSPRWEGWGSAVKVTHITPVQTE